jgi:hypothetical protein
MQHSEIRVHQNASATRFYQPVWHPKEREGYDQMNFSILPEAAKHFFVYSYHTINMIYVIKITLSISMCAKLKHFIQ